MSTNVERGLAHDENSNSFINFPQIPYGSPRHLVGFFLKNMFLNPKRKLKPVLVPCVLKTPEINVIYTFSQTSLC